MNANDNKSGFYLLSDNTDAFLARYALIRAASKTLDIQYYIMHSDASGQYLGYAVLEAADRGVKVRILVDDINISGRDRRFKLFSLHENIEVRIFNPLSSRNFFRSIELIVNLDRAGRRMHNKAFISDNKAAIIGGRNIGDEYFDARHNLNFVDLDMLSIGPIVNDISVSFNDYWNSHWATAIDDISKAVVVKKQLTHIRKNLRDRWHKARNTEYFQSLKHAEFTHAIISNEVPFVWAQATLFYDRPDKLVTREPQPTIHFGPRIMPYFEQATKELLFASPYFVPGNFGAHWFAKKRQQGVKIKILTNSLAATDVAAVHAGYKKYRKQLLQDKIELFELKPTARFFTFKPKKKSASKVNASLHAKYMVLDQHYVFIGSANLDPRSGNLNTEIGIMVDSAELAEQTSRLFERSTTAENSYRLSLKDGANTLLWTTIEDGRKKSYDSEPEIRFWRKLYVFLIGLLPIENLL